MPVDTTVALISLTEAKSYLKITGSGEDAILTDFVDSISKAVATYCRRKLVKATFTEYYNGGGIGRINLKNYPIVSITTIHDDSNRTYDATTLVDSDDYYFDADKGFVELYDGGIFTDSVQNVKIVYLAGYVAGTDMPYDIELACKIWLSKVYHQYSKQSIHVSSESLRERSVSYRQEDIPIEVKRLLERYRDSFRSIEC